MAEKGSLREGAGAGGLPRATEGECVTMKLGGTESSADSFHHFVVPRIRLRMASRREAIERSLHYC